jgi:DNA excision repair protein ERCC-1
MRVERVKLKNAFVADIAFFAMAAVRPPVVQPGTGNNIVINPNQVDCKALYCQLALTIFRLQRLNPVLECVRNVGKEFGDIVCDFQVGRTTGVLFLRCVQYTSSERLKFIVYSLKYHRLHPEYIHQRIEKLGHSYTLRILLVLSDVVRDLSLYLSYLFNIECYRANTKIQFVILQRSVYLLPCRPHE